jgi:hypothetical protein
MNPITLFLSAAFVLAGVAVGQWVSLYLAPPFFAIAILIGLSVKVANAWQKYVILRVGKLQSVKGAGFFMVIPLLDDVIAIIDERIQTTAFNAEQALTKDTVPVNVDAIIFWHVHDAQKAALALATPFFDCSARVHCNKSPPWSAHLHASSAVLGCARNRGILRRVMKDDRSDDKRS